MRICLSVVVSIIMILLINSVSFAENWVPFFKSAAELDFYYAEDSIAYTKDGTTLIWYKIVPQEQAKFKPWIEALYLREFDCDRRKYKILQRKIVSEYKPIETNNKETSWIYLEPDDLDTAFYKIVCETLKK